MLGDTVIRWTARLFVACYIGRLCVDATGRRDAAAQRAARWLWTFGCGLCLLHIAAAFHWQHDWNHAAAYEHVRQRTLRDIGWNSGAGLYINYGCTLLWLADTILWWRKLDWPESKLVYWSLQIAFAFLMSQATAGFGPAFWKPITLAVAVALIAIRLSSGRPIHERPA